MLIKLLVLLCNLLPDSFLMATPRLSLVVRMAHLPLEACHIALAHLLVVLELGLTFNDLLLLFGDVGGCNVLKGHLTVHELALIAVQVCQLVTAGNVVANVQAMLHIVVLIVLLVQLLLMDLPVVKLAHLDSVFCLFLMLPLIIYLMANEII